MYKQTRIKPFEFVSVVSGGGYEWIRAAALNKGTPSPVGLFLVARVEPGVAAKAHEPLEHTGLFREFSELATKRAAILKFANAYGPLLGLPFPVAQTDGRGRFKSGKHLLVGGERFEQWTTAITEMRTLIGLWRAIVERDHGALRRVVVWHEDYVSYQVSMAGRLRQRIIANKNIDKRAFAIFSKNDLLLPARWALQSELNERLSASFGSITTPRLIWTLNGDLQLALSPSNLLAALWLQFAQAFAGNYRIRTCRGCGKFFQVGAGGDKRADATTCSDTCRQRARRKEKTNERV